jgi:hypothetical protein
MTETDIHRGYVQAAAPEDRLSAAIDAVTGGISSMRYSPMVNLVSQLRRHPTEQYARELADRMRTQLGIDACYARWRDMNYILLALHGMQIGTPHEELDALTFWHQQMALLLAEEDH